MKFSLKSKDVIKFSNLHFYNPIIIHYVGGTFGNFLYRMIHRYLSGFPKLEDDFIFVNGNSHAIYDIQYFKDFGTTDNKKDIYVIKDIDFDLCLIKKHCYPKIKFSNCSLYKESYLNIKITIPDHSHYVLALIQNLYKLENKDVFEMSEIFDIKWIIKNNIEHYNKIENSIEHMVKALDKSWFQNKSDEKTYSINFIDLFDCEKFYNHLQKLSVLLNQNLIKSKEEFIKEHSIFLKNQYFYDSFCRHSSKTWNDDIILDRLMKKFVD